MPVLLPVTPAVFKSFSAIVIGVAQPRLFGVPDPMPLVIVKAPCEPPEVVPLATRNSDAFTLPLLPRFKSIAKVHWKPGLNFEPLTLAIEPLG